MGVGFCDDGEVGGWVIVVLGSNFDVGDGSGFV